MYVYIHVTTTQIKLQNTFRPPTPPRRLPNLDSIDTHSQR